MVFVGLYFLKSSFMQQEAKNYPGTHSATFPEDFSPFLDPQLLLLGLALPDRGRELPRGEVERDAAEGPRRCEAGDRGLLDRYLPG